VIRSVEQIRCDVGRAIVAPLSAPMPLSSHDTGALQPPTDTIPTHTEGRHELCLSNSSLSRQCHRTPGVGVLETPDGPCPAPDSPAPAGRASRSAGGDRDWHVHR
jgi:hypothetical protein